MKQEIAVLGGGNGALTMAADMTLAGFDVRLYEMPQFASNIEMVFRTHQLTLTGLSRTGVAKLHTVTSDIAEAVEGAKMILLVVPAFVHKGYAELLAPHLKAGQKVLLLPGTLGALEFARILQEKGNTEGVILGETDTLPYACRRTGANSVHVHHLLKSFGMGIFPSVHTEETISAFRTLYHCVTPFTNVLECGLNSLNPVLHPASVLLNTGRVEYSRGEFYLYEEGISHAVARVLEALDRERIAVGKTYGFNLPTLEQGLFETGYGPKGTIWQAIKASDGLTPIKGPSSLQNRYLTEDIPYGLVTWCDLADKTGVPVPVIKAVVQLGSIVMEKDCWSEGRRISDLGIAEMNLEELRKYLTEGTAGS